MILETLYTYNDEIIRKLTSHLINSSLIPYKIVNLKERNYIILYYKPIKNKISVSHFISEIIVKIIIIDIIYLIEIYYKLNSKDIYYKERCRFTKEDFNPKSIINLIKKSI